MTWLPGVARGDAALILALDAILLAVAIALAVGSRWGRDPVGLALIASAPLIPTLRLPGLFGLSSDDLLPLAGLGVLVYGLVRERARPALPWSRPRSWLYLVLAGGLVLLVLGGLVSAALNAGPTAGAVQLFARGAGRFVFLAAIVIAVGLRIGRSPELARPAIAFIAVVGTIEAVFGLLAYVIGLPDGLGLSGTRRSVIAGEVPGRIVGTLGISSNFVGAVLMVTSILTAGLALSSSGERRRWWFVAAALQLAALALTYSRVPLGLGIIGLGALVVLANRPILLAPLAAAGASIALFTPLVNRILNDTNDRIALWSAAIRLIADFPMGGVGPGRTLEVMRANPERYMETAAGIARNNAHNTILLAGAEMGIPAAIGALFVNAGIAGLALVTLLEAVRTAPRSPMLIAGSLAVLAFLAQGMVNNLFTVGVTGVLFAFVTGALLWNPATTRPPAGT